jgi:hypothetical protein
MVGRVGKIDMGRWGRDVKVPQMEVQRIARGPDVRVLRYVCGKQSVQEGEGKVCQRYREQHPACLTVKAAIVFRRGFGQPQATRLPASSGRSLPHNTCNWSCDPISAAVYAFTSRYGRSSLDCSLTAEKKSASTNTLELLYSCMPRDCFQVTIQVWNVRVTFCALSIKFP